MFYYNTMMKDFLYNSFLYIQFFECNIESQRWVYCQINKTFKVVTIGLRIALRSIHDWP